MGCAICDSSIVDNPRYPNMVCAGCQICLTDKNGRQVVFFNESMSGGLASHYVDTEEPYNSKQCFINNIKCEAKEGRFGGIIIEKTI